MKLATLKTGTVSVVSVLLAACALLPAHADRLVIPLTDTESLTHFEEFNWFGGENDFSAGISFADFDGDGDLDIVSVNGRHWPVADVLLLNDGKGHFPMAAEIGEWRTTGYGGCPADIDDDGDMDLLTAEIVSGIASAALLLDEPFGLPEVVGSIAILGAALVEVLAQREPHTRGGNSAANPSCRR